MNKSYLIATAILIAVAAWLGSGYLQPRHPPAAAEVAPAGQEVTPFRVQVRDQRAEPVEREIIVQGQVEPNRRVTLRAETPGQVTAVLVEKGRRVRTGEVILRLEMDDRQARLKRAQALLRQRQRDYQALSRLGQRGLQAETRVNQAAADLEAARADLEAIELEIENTAIRAPFEAIVNDRMVEFGDYVARLDEVLELVDDDPMVVTGRVPQQNVHQIGVGRVATVTLVTGHEARGLIRYVSAVADPETRTFRFELEVPNPGGELPAGISASIRIPIETVASHLVSPALLSLGRDGALGIKTVDGDDRVRFHPVSIVRAGPGGVWVSGLPERARVITAGQGFVTAGERVAPVPEPEATGRPEERSVAPDHA